MPNLLEETLHEITEIGKTLNDIVFIGSRDGQFYCTVEQFKKLADFRYSSSKRMIHCKRR